MSTIVKECECGAYFAIGSDSILEECSICNPDAHEDNEHDMCQYCRFFFNDANCEVTDAELEEIVSTCVHWERNDKCWWT
jgi:hypothetical protein